MSRYMKLLPLLLALPLTASAAPSGQTGADVHLPQAGIAGQDIRAQLLPRQFTTLAAEIGARIDRLPVREGERFKEGDLLISFDCSTQQALLRKASAELNAARQTLKANERLAELKSIGNLELNLSRANVEKGEAEVGYQKAMLGKCGIRAPFSGRMSDQMVRNQQYVQPGQELMEVIDDSVLELEFLVPSGWLGWLKPGLAFEVKIDETGRSYPARFTRLGARIDPVSQSIKVAAAIDGSYPELLTGMSGHVLLSPAPTAKAPQ